MMDSIIHNVLVWLPAHCAGAYWPYVHFHLNAPIFIEQWLVLGITKENGRGAELVIIE